MEFGFKEISGVMSFGALILTLVLNWRSVRRTSPQAEKWAEWTKWRGEVDEKLRNDFHAIGQLRRENDNTAEVQRLLLQGVGLLVANAASNSNSTEMLEFQKTINHFFAERAANVQ